MNDAQYGSEIKYLKKLGLDLGVAQQLMPDIMLLAKAFGGDGVILETEHDLAKVELPLSGLFLVVVRIDPEVNSANI